ncbi:hypothetical protein IFM89_018276 [Coptis chinensis]|uniref:tRNA(Ile)-lysidine synthetase n=1 Tax=Coptis chinensis TaxID=261450 RepID=A0A835M2V2_9MAGN|nr:hypothetical protein IFM89_018276 [Coptis chinensis]
MAREKKFLICVTKMSNKPSPILGLLKTKLTNPKMLLKPLNLTSKRFFCKCSHQQHPKIDLSKYKQTFSQRMAMAGLKPHHKIAMGVSGGPDSIALCVLAANWKSDACIGTDESNGCIQGLLAIIVDHNLRVESKDEADCVHDRVSKMGISCEIARCDWSDGRPKQGHLQEMARDMRYQIFQNVCIEKQIGVLLIAHHADDQAELFILRLSRNSGVLGLAGMASTSQLFPEYIHHCGETSCSHGILLVRPLLEFSKEDLYRTWSTFMEEKIVWLMYRVSALYMLSNSLQICQGSKQEWVEDPTNRSPLFARNRIRMSLTNLSSGMMRSELQAIILACRKTRSYVDKVCSDLIKRAVTITAHGYAIIDLEKLDPLNIEDVCLSKFSALVLQFISQRHRPVRGRTSRLILDYIRKYPCKTSLTAAGCYLCAVPQSKGTKIMVCISLHSPHPSEMDSSYCYPCEVKDKCTTNEIDQIIDNGKTYSDCFVPDASNVPFLHATSSEAILSEGKRVNILSESIYNSILTLQREEIKNFETKTEVTSGNEQRHDITSGITTLGEPLHSGKSFHFMNRFLVTWKLNGTITERTLLLDEVGPHWDPESGLQDFLCPSCAVRHDRVAGVRHMTDTDWLYLANLLRGQISEESPEQNTPEMGNRHEKTFSCSDFVRLSTQRALRALKLIPVAARRSLPVLVSSQGLLLSIPSIGFEHCPYLMASAVFKPRVPLGGGYSSFV